ncbi:unnamed protein product [Lampetra planeri]
MRLAEPQVPGQSFKPKSTPPPPELPRPIEKQDLECSCVRIGHARHRRAEARRPPSSLTLPKSGKSDGFGVRQSFERNSSCVEAFDAPRI